MPRPSRLARLIRPFTRKGWGHWLRFLVLLVAASFTGHVLSSSAWLTPFRYSIYHRQLLMRDRSQLYPTRTALVLLNDDDYWGDRFQSRTPLKRNELANVMDTLMNAGVNTVALDVFLLSPRPLKPEFEFSDYRSEDARLIESIERMCQAGRHVVLSTSIRFGDDGYEELPSLYTGELKQLPCVRRGYIQLPFDMRRIPGSLELANGDHLDSLSLAMVGNADPTAYSQAAADSGHGFRFSEYLTQQDFDTKNGRQFVFNGLDMLPPTGQQMSAAQLQKLRDQLANKLVIVGASWHENAYGTGALVDEHNSPGGLEPGAMLHANYVEAMLDRTGTFTPISDSTAEVLEIALAVALAMIGVLEIHSAWKWAAFAIAILLSVLVSYTLLQNLGLFLDFLVPLLMIIAHSLAEEGLKTWHEFRHLKHNAEHKHTHESTGGSQ